MCVGLTSLSLVLCVEDDMHGTIAAAGVVGEGGCGWHMPQHLIVAHTALKQIVDIVAGAQAASNVA